MRIILLLALLVGFVLLHIVKMMRLYLILIDRRIPLERFAFGYLRTTLVNLVVPFKLGELYRVGVFYRITGGFKTGFFSILIDRFFDTLAIVLLLLPYQIMIAGKVTLPVVFLSVFLIVIMFGYLIFPSTYTFLNRYIITSRTSAKSMAALRGLEVLHEWYEYARALVLGRYGVLILLSLLAWLIEMTIISGFARITGFGFGISDFGNYIESIISGSSYAFSRMYTVLSVLVIFVATVISCIYSVVLSKRRSTK